MLKNMKIRSRLLLGFGFLLLFLVGMAVFALVEMNSLAKLTQELYDHPLTVSNAIRDANTNIIKIQRSMKEVIMSKDEEHLNLAAEAIDDFEEKVYDNLDLVEQQFLGDKSKIKELRKEFAGWKPIRDEEIRLMREGKQQEAYDITKGKAARYVEKLEKDINEVIEFAGNKATNFLDGATEAKENSRLYLILITVIAVVIAIIIAWLITLSIVRPLTQAVTVADELSKNNLAISVEDIGGSDESGKLLSAMKEMLNNLRQQLSEITEGINVLAGSATEISATSTQFASSFTEIASSISETVTSMKEVRQTADLSSQKAKDVAVGSQNVVQVSRDGEKSVNETILAMNAIQEQMSSIAESIVGLSEQTQSIGDIIAVVDDIAEQSRLLAVNASIEAVKAGEQGKGFSVVAAEIKNLAQQSKQSTNQVRNILSEIQKATTNSVMVTEKGNKSVDNGARQVRDTGDAIQTLGRSVVESSQAATQIEATSRQQLAGIDQVFSAMESINAAISQNAEGARQLEESSRDLDELGKRLKSLVERYNI